MLATGCANVKKKELGNLASQSDQTGGRMAFAPFSGKLSVDDRDYQFQTRRCIERISQSVLDCNPDALSVLNFLENEQQHVLQLQMIDADEWTGLTKLYQVLQKTGRLTEGQYTVLTLKRFLKVNQLKDMSTLMQSTGTPHLLLMACEDNQVLNEETKDVIRTFFETIKQKPGIKIFLITRSASSSYPCLQQVGREIFGEGFVTRDEQVTWSDITDSSKEKLLKKSVKFQGFDISLDELISAESPVVNFLPLGDLLEEKELTIAYPVPISNGYNEAYYMGRTLRCQRTIKQDIFNERHVSDSHVYLARTEKEYKEFCQQDQENNVHWLKQDKSGKIFWQKSQGSLETLRRYIDTDSSHTYTADHLDKLLEQAQYQRVMLISDRAGMGKSTVLTHLSKQIKQKFPGKWVVRIDLNDHTDALKALKQGKIDKEKAIEFLSEKMLKLSPGFEMELFKRCCEQKQKLSIVVMLDVFDEISPFYKETLIYLLQALRQTAVEQLWVTSRPHLRRELEDKLQQLSYTIDPFSEKDQVEFLTKFWSLNDWCAEMDDKKKEEKKKKSAIYAEKLIKEISQSVIGKETEFTGIPLQCRMLAEAFNNNVRIHYQSAESMSELLFKSEFLGLYGQFIERKSDIYKEEKFQVCANYVVTVEQREFVLKFMKAFKRSLSLKVLFTQEYVTLFQFSTRCKYSAIQSSTNELMDANYEDKLHFIYRTFQEYHVAEFFVNQLTNENNPSSDYLLKDIFRAENYRVVRIFMDILISRYVLKKKVLEQYGSRISDLRENSERVLYQAARESNSRIIGFLLKSLQVSKHGVNELLLAKNEDGQTAWQLAIESGSIQVLEKLWKCAKKTLTMEELKNNFFLASWHVAAEKGSSELLQQLWEWAKELPTPEALNNKLLLARDLKGRTAWHMAAKNVDSEVLQKLWEWAKEKLTTEELNNEVLLGTEKLGQTCWVYAIVSGKIYSLQELWEMAKEKLTPDDLNNKFLLTKDNRGRTAWHTAAEWGKLDLLQKLCEWAKEKLTTDDFKNKILLAKDNTGRNAWHVAAERCKVDLLQNLWDWAKKVLITEEINDILLLARDDDKQTFLHVAVKTPDTNIFEELLDWCTENLSGQVKNKLLSAKDCYKQTVLNVATNRHGTRVSQKLRDWVNQR